MGQCGLISVKRKERRDKECEIPEGASGQGDKRDGHVHLLHVCACLCFCLCTGVGFFYLRGCYFVDFFL